MTMQAMALFGVDSRNLTVQGVGKFQTPEFVITEGDWSNAAFFLAANMLGSDVDVVNLRFDSIQGDRAVAGLIPALAQRVQIDCSNIPDLVPILAILAAANECAVFTGIRRLLLKESDRVASILSMVEALGGKGDATEDTLTIHGTGFIGGRVDACNDHRIAMSAAIAATVCKENVTIIGAEAVNKSYPHFWEDYRALGGNYEQHIR
jgi:3-phosphoshikimate 1-carboxyvinyltransferase